VKAARRLFYVIITTAIMFEELPDARDSLGFIGWYVHADLKSWTPISLAVPPLMIALFSCVLLGLNRSLRERREYPYQGGQLNIPILCFAAAVAIGIVQGMIHVGFDEKTMYFEVRGFLVLVVAYFLAGLLLRDERHFDGLIWSVLIGCTWLALENLYRALYVVGVEAIGTSDNTFDHVDSVVLGFGCVICLGLLVFKGKQAQQRVSIAVFPLYIVCMAVMQRRAAWPVVGVGLIVLALAMYRARPKMFWRVVPAAALLAALYLGAFWSNTSIIGQPARAIRSQFQPDQRDFASNLYREIEHADILANIATSRYLGLGFGQQFVFYYRLPNLDWWSFWHYTPHDSVLWLWMDGGIPVFGAFMWLTGSALFYGGQELTRRQEAWSLAEQWHTWRKKGRSRPGAYETERAAEIGSRTATARETSGPAVPNRQRAVLSKAQERPVALPHGSPTVLLEAGMALVVMQIIFSYVDLGLTSLRDLLLLGVMFGVIGHAYLARPTPMRRLRPRGSRRRTQDVERGAPPEPATLLPVSVPSGDSRDLVSALAARGDRRYSILQHG
jgi:hypothetical protein